MAEKITGGSDNKLTLSAFIVVVLFLGVNFVAVKFSNRELQPFWGASLRFIIASVLLFGISRIRNIPLPKGSALIGAALFGLFSFAINFGFLYWALTRVSAGMASVKFASIPLITLLIASMIGMERITWRCILGAVIVMGGISLVFAEQLKFDTPFVHLVAVLIAVVSAALSGIVVKYFPEESPHLYQRSGDVRSSDSSSRPFHFLRRNSRLTLPHTDMAGFRMVGYQFHCRICVAGGEKPTPTFLLG